MMIFYSKCYYYTIAEACTLYFKLKHSVKKFAVEIYDKICILIFYPIGYCLYSNI